MNIQTKPVAAVRHEAMRIAGKRVETDQRIDVLNPYNGAVVGTVPAARPEHVREAFAKAKAFKPKLTRYERQQILLRTADHGMNSKTRLDASPNVIYLQDVLDAWLGAGRSRVILPITDPYVAHHGALGSFATVYLPAGADVDAILGRLRPVEGVDVALERDAACARFELPPDRLGDIVVVSTIHKVLGTARERHDLSGLTEPLRSHGGLTEQVVPMIANRAVTLAAGHQLRNFDIFDVALNRVAA